MIIRQANPEDQEAILHLHQTVAELTGGIARLPNEITPNYINQVFVSVQNNGLMLLGIDETSQQVIAEIHAYKYGIQIFDHVLTNLTIAVHPYFQGEGIGKQLFTAFLQEVIHNYSEITRVELESRISNSKSIGLYKAVGFVEEGRMQGKTRNQDGSLEDSILLAWYRPS